MVAKRVNSDTEILDGQWVCRVPNEPYGLCSSPVRINGIVGKRLHFKNPLPGALVAEKYMMRASAVFVCDTEAEAQALSALSDERIAAVAKATNEVVAAYESKLAKLLGEQ